ncbi:hypothetical protein QFC22_003176 [Naganishia vaughanmartiniae]|uniref:Uncharacterized protein n=1 Tax=Naganishia vaughanmartiniae TaxID=1424756 RepID=A0ACC2X9H0_9TREE|nr:hypothetical protein QFC22_003176 [Naganishia vaughanmartiniae]
MHRTTTIMSLQTAIHLSTPSTEPVTPHLKPTDVNLLPFHLAGYTGPAALDVYFTPRPSAELLGLGHASSTAAVVENEDKSKEGVTEGYTGRSAAFRGRQVYEHLLLLPEGYTGVVFAAPPPPSGRTEDVPPPATTINSLHQLPSSPPPNRVGTEVTPRRSSRKRKVGGDFVVGSGQEKAQVQVKRARLKKPVGRFSLDDDDEDEDEDEDEEKGEGGKEPVEKQETNPDSPSTSRDTKEERQLEAEEKGEETQVEVHVVIDVPLPKASPETNGRTPIVPGTTKQQQEKGDSLVIVDEALVVASSLTSPTVLGVGSPASAQATPAHDEKPIVFAKEVTDVSMDEDTRSSTPIDTQTATPMDTQPPTPEDTETGNHQQPTTSNNANTRHIRPRATFSGLTIWSADEPMYTLPTRTTEQEKPVTFGHDEAEGRAVEVDVRGVMAERDEFARSLQEWRRLAEVVHEW